MSNEIMYVLLPDYAAHEAVYLSQAIASDEFALKENPKYVNKIVAPTLEPVKSIGGFRTLPDYYRSLPGKFAQNLVNMDKNGASNEELGKAMGGLRGLRIGMLEGNSDEGYISLGTGIGAIRAVQTVAQVVDELMLGVRSSVVPTGT